jgi:hypothetical protein
MSFFLLHNGSSAAFFGFLHNTFMSLIWFIEKNMTVDFFIYFIFLPISIIPSIIINHAGRYTLPYSKSGKVKKRRSSGRRGLRLARYHGSLRSKSAIICPHLLIITTFKGGRRFSHQVRSPKTTDPISTLPTQKGPNPIPSLSTSYQVDALIADDPSISLDLLLFESKLYWDSLSQESLITTSYFLLSKRQLLLAFLQCN